MGSRIAALAWAAAIAFAATPGADLAAELRDIALDPNECYRVRDLAFAREDLRFYLTEGYLTFAKETGGARVAAVFTADTDGGDAEIIVMPPHKSERRSLTIYTGSPNLSEHFGAAVFLFSDNTYEELVKQIREGAERRSPERGALLAEEWTPVLRNLAASFESRLLLDLLSGRNPRHTFFSGALRGRKLGNFDVHCDRRGAEQIVLGQLATRDNRTYFDVWTSFQSQSVRRAGEPPLEGEARLADYRISATIDPDLKLSATTRVKVTPESPTRVVPFDISSRIEVKAVRVDGAAAEVVQRESLRSNLLRATGNDMFLVVPAEPLQAGRAYEFEFAHEGVVIGRAGNGIYYVGSRSNWYPNRGLHFTHFDLTFRYPKTLDLVTTGQLVEEKEEGEWKVTHRRTSVPIRMAGFNLGEYERVKVKRAGYEVEVYGARAAAPPPAREAILIQPNPFPQRGLPRRPPEILGLPPEPPPSLTSRLTELANEVGNELEFMSSRFGPAALPQLTVSPVPGTFGQGFPGLIYLSTLSYMRHDAKPLAAMSAQQQAFFTEILHAHETAHQWWGNVVTSSDYHDGWLMEALANYSALLYLEKRRGARMMDAALAEYRRNLLQETDTGAIVDAAGPIVMGTRLESSAVPQAWRAIAYGKGSWLMHMLRKQMGDASFDAMLGDLRKQYEWKSITTEGFRKLAARHLPPKWADAQLESFFDTWVYGTGIPQLSLEHSVKGLKLTITVTQTRAPEDFSVMVPVEVQFARGKPRVYWVQTSSEPVTITATLPSRPARVLLDPGNAVLKR